MTVADKFTGVNLGDMNTIKRGEFSSVIWGVSQPARMPAASDNQNFASGIFCLTSPYCGGQSGLTLRTVRAEIAQDDGFGSAELGFCYLFVP